MSQKKYIAIAGNIGAGKSSLTQLISKQFKWESYYEQVEDNPYLADFYGDMSRWSFNLQVFFLSSRFNQQKEIDSRPYSVVQDRSIYEDVEIFARNLHEMNLMDERDYQNYRALFELMTSYLNPPDLLVYLKANVKTLVGQIETRGREYETGISIEYLKRLNELYDDWIQRYPYPKLVVESDELDFVNNEEHQAEVLSLIESRISGLFPD